MSFESLANELLLDLFEYFDGIELFRAFHGINSRFNRLLFIYSQVYRFDFHSISKQNFDIVCQDYFPKIIDKIISLTISDDDETPNLSELFVSYGFTLDKFTRLKSLSLYSIQSFDQLIFHCRVLSYLTHLYLVDDRKKENIHLFINNIWSLVKLRYFYLNCNSIGRRWINKISMISLSIESLFIENTSCSLEDLLNLFKYTPSLRHLSVTVVFLLKDEQISIITSLITSLKLTFESSVPVLMKLFEMMPNLNSLTLKTMDIYLSGNKWKKILQKYLSKLKIFNLRMYFQFPHDKTIDEHLNKLINSYRTSFWIENHQWFVQCDCIPFGTYHHGILYTLPYSFQNFLSYDTLKSKYTCPNQTMYWSYNQVKTLEYMTYTNDSFLLPIQFPNIQHLKIGIPFDEKFWSCITSLHRLTSLEIVISENFSYEQLQTLLDLSPKLYSLTFFYAINFKISLAQLISPSIRRLSFITNIPYFNHIDCTDLAYSRLGRQCEVLLIKIENRMIVLDLVKTMKQLRSLVFQSKDDQWNIKDLFSTQDELVDWLRIYLSSTYSISRDKNNIRIWIGEKGINSLLSC